MSKAGRAAAQTAVRRAAAEFVAKNWARADVLVRAVLAEDRSIGDAYQLQAVMAASLDRWDAAARAARAGIEADPYHKPLRKALSLYELNARAWPGPPAPDGSRLMLIKPWGCGFWSDVYHVLSACLLAEYTGRTPVVHWGEGSLFCDAGGGDAWPACFQPVSDVAPETVFGHDGGVFHPRWQGRLAGPSLPWMEGDGSRLHGPLLLGRAEAVVVADFATPIVAVTPWALDGHWSLSLDPNAVLRVLMARYARPSTLATERAAAAAATLPDLARCVAVHIRGTDKAIENARLPALHRAYAAAIDAAMKLGDVDHIFLLTDDRTALAAMQQQYGPRVVTLPAARADGTDGVHYLNLAPRGELAMQVLVDVMLAARCRRFIGLGSSNVSTAVYHRRDWGPGEAVLVDRCLHEYDFSGQTLHGPF